MQEYIRNGLDRNNKPSFTKAVNILFYAKIVSFFNHIEFVMYAWKWIQSDAAKMVLVQVIGNSIVVLSTYPFFYFNC